MAQFGLITDQPSDSIPTAAWSKALNVRCKDNSVQGVNLFETMSIPLPTGFTGTMKPVAVTQWTRAGSGALELAFIVSFDGSNRGFVFLYNGTTTVDITGLSGLNFDVDDNYPPQIFVFNEVLIVNPGTSQPMYSARVAGVPFDMLALPGFAALSTTTEISFARVMRPFGNRLVAMNWHDFGTTSGDTSDDTEQPIDFVWSSNVGSIASLTDAVWQAAIAGSTAGDAFLTSTPGVILDGIQLGGVFLAFKTDSIVRVTEIGAPFTLGFDSVYEDDGIYATSCVANIGNDNVLVVGNYGVSILDPQQNKEDIAQGIFKEALYKASNPLHKNRAFVFQQTRDKEVWFCYSSTTNTGNGCDMAFVYDYNGKKLHLRTLPNVLGLYETEIAGTLRIFGASPDSGMHELSTSLQEADGYFVIENKLAENANATKDIVEVQINSGANVKVAITGTNNITASKTYTDLPTFNPADNYKLDCRVSGRYMNIRVTMDGGLSPMLTTMIFKMRMNGRR